MKNKPGDIPYCGVRKSVIEKAKPKLDAEVLEHLVHFIKERYKIHILKDIEYQPAPWTDDPILRSYRFTNVRREHDKETKWLIKHITSNSELVYEDKLLNCILFRLFNKHETCELIGMPIKFSQGYESEDYREIFEQKRKDDPDYVFFTGAFISGGMKSAFKRYSPAGTWDMCMRVMYFIDYLIRDEFTSGIGCTTDEFVSSPDKIFELMKEYKGIGDFLAYQVFVDFTYINEFPSSENEFVVAGPGCKRGLDCLFESRGGMTYEECLFWLRDNWTKLMKNYGIQWNSDEIFTDLPDYDHCMNIMSLENCFCELSKYERAINGSGRPRARYNGNGG